MQNKISNRLLVSVIIPCYNSSNTIQQTLKSVIHQSFTDFEIIIIDDASDDIQKTEAIIDSFNDVRIRLIRHQENKNGAVARNTGIQAAKGDYIAFLDADDEWERNHLEISIKTLKSTNSDLSYSRCKMITTPPYIYLPRKAISHNQKISEYLFVDGEVMYTPSLVVKKNIALKILFNEKLIRHQDYDFLLRFESLKGKISYIPIQTVIVHWENNNPKKKGGTWDFSLKFIKEYNKFFTSKATSKFIFKFVILPLLEENKRWKAIKVLHTETSIFHFNLKDFYFFSSYFIFGKFIFPSILK